MNSMDQSEKEVTPQGDKKTTWLKRIGVAGFLFFLIKGIAWLVIAYFAGDAIFS